MDMTFWWLTTGATRAKVKIQQSKSNPHLYSYNVYKQNALEGLKQLPGVK
jgi:hypothetical protein